MALKLEKGQRINLRKDIGSNLEHFCVGCNWGAIVEKKSKFFGLITTQEIRDVDLDLSCIIVDEQGNMCDHIYSPLYRADFLKRYNMPLGKLDSKDQALHHSGDDLQGDQNGDDGLDNEIITVNLKKLNPEVQQLFFFLNNCGREDFSQIPYASIRMYDGTPTKVNKVFLEYNVAAKPEYRGMRALIMGKLYLRNGEWKFAAIGDAFPDANICVTVNRICSSYVK